MRDTSEFKADAKREFTAWLDSVLAVSAARITDSDGNFLRYDLKPDAESLRALRMLADGKTPSRGRPQSIIYLA